jgi:hypothetical protein
LLSWSVTWAATIVTVQVSLPTRSVSGLSVQVVGPPETVAVCAPEVVQEMVNHVPVTSTGSLKVTVMSEVGFTPSALSAGVVAVTVGAASTSIVTVAVSSTPGFGGAWPLESVYLKVSVPSKPEAGV